MSSGSGLDPRLIPSLLDALSAEVTIVTMGHEGRYVSRAVRPTACSDADVPGGAVLAGSNLDDFRPQLDGAATGACPVRWEGWLTDIEGRTRYLHHVFAPAPDQGAGDILVITRDLTTQKVRERELTLEIAALHEAEAATAALMAVSLDCIVIVDLDDRVVEFNPASEATFGYTRLQAIGRPVADLIVPPSMRHQHRTGMQRYQRTGVPHMLNRRVEFEAMRADGSLFPVELSVVELQAAGGRCFAAFLRDLTTSKAAQRDAEVQRLQLHEAEQRAVTASLLSGIAHELNNPMAILLAQATLLQSRAENDDARARAGKIYRAAERAARIVKTFVAMAGERPSERRPTDVRHLVESAVDMTAYGRRSAGIDLLADWGSGSRQAVTDAPLLGQVVTTLLVRATQALSGRPGPRTIWLTVRGWPDRVAIELAHNGSDLQPDDSARVAVSPVIGAWAGLSVARDIVVSHGGTLVVASRDGGGVTFRITLPAAPCAEDDPPQGGPPPDVGLSILIVDDDREVAEALADMLEIDGHRTALVHDAAEALSRALHRSVDLVFADLRMPGISGLDLHRRLTEARPELDRRFVLVTGDTVGALDVRQDVPPGGRMLILAKPFSLRDVRAVLAGAMLPADRRAADDHR